MISVLSRNFFFRTTAIILIQAFLLIDISWACGGRLNDIDDSKVFEDNYLAPSLIINHSDFSSYFSSPEDITANQFSSLSSAEIETLTYKLGLTLTNEKQAAREIEEIKKEQFKIMDQFSEGLENKEQREKALNQVVRDTNKAIDTLRADFVVQERAKAELKIKAEELKIEAEIAKLKLGKERRENFAKEAQQAYDQEIAKLIKEIKDAAKSKKRKAEEEYKERVSKIEECVSKIKEGLLEGIYISDSLAQDIEKIKQDTNARIQKIAADMRTEKGFLSDTVRGIIIGVFKIAWYWPKGKIAVLKIELSTHEGYDLSKSRSRFKAEVKEINKSAKAEIEAVRDGKDKRTHKLKEELDQAGLNIEKDKTRLEQLESDKKKQPETIRQEVENAIKEAQKDAALKILSGLQGDEYVELRLKALETVLPLVKLYEDRQSEGQMDMRIESREESIAALFLRAYREGLSAISITDAKQLPSPEAAKAQQIVNRHIKRSRKKNEDKRKPLKYIPGIELVVSLDGEKVPVIIYLPENSRNLANDKTVQDLLARRRPFMLQELAHILYVYNGKIALADAHKSLKAAQIFFERMAEFVIKGRIPLRSVLGVVYYEGTKQKSDEPDSPEKQKLMEYIARLCVHHPVYKQSELFFLPGTNFSGSVDLEKENMLGSGADRHPHETSYRDRILKAVNYKSGLWEKIVYEYEGFLKNVYIWGLMITAGVTIVGTHSLILAGLFAVMFYYLIATYPGSKKSALKQQVQVIPQADIASEEMMKYKDWKFDPAKIPQPKPESEKSASKWGKVMETAGNIFDKLDILENLFYRATAGTKYFAGSLREHLNKNKITNNFFRNDLKPWQKWTFFISSLTISGVLAGWLAGSAWLGIKIGALVWGIAIALKIFVYITDWDMVLLLFGFAGSGIAGWFLGKDYPWQGAFIGLTGWTGFLNRKGIISFFRDRIRKEIDFYKRFRMLGPKAVFIRKTLKLQQDMAKGIVYVNMVGKSFGLRKIEVVNVLAKHGFEYVKIQDASTLVFAKKDVMRRIGAEFLKTALEKSGTSWEKMTETLNKITEHFEKMLVEVTLSTGNGRTRKMFIPDPREIADDQVMYKLYRIIAMYKAQGLVLENPQTRLVVDVKGADGQVRPVTANELALVMNKYFDIVVPMPEEGSTPVKSRISQGEVRILEATGQLNELWEQGVKSLVSINLGSQIRVIVAELLKDEKIGTIRVTSYPTELGRDLIDFSSEAGKSVESLISDQAILEAAEEMGLLETIAREFNMDKESVTPEHIGLIAAGRNPFNQEQELYQPVEVKKSTMHMGSKYFGGDTGSKLERLEAVAQELWKKIDRKIADFIIKLDADRAAEPGKTSYHLSGETMTLDIAKLRTENLRRFLEEKKAEHIEFSCGEDPLSGNAIIDHDLERSSEITEPALLVEMAI
ncbi:MAG: hypothetical protein GY853_00290 [PVC group bacterium]|nr:hypothetical protein [PVC group bacterium]